MSLPKKMKNDRLDFMEAKERISLLLEVEPLLIRHLFASSQRLILIRQRKKRNTNIRTNIRVRIRISTNTRTNTRRRNEAEVEAGREALDLKEETTAMITIKGVKRMMTDARTVRGTEKRAKNVDAVPRPDEAD